MTHKHLSKSDLNYVFTNYESMRNKDIASQLGVTQIVIDRLISRLTPLELLEKTQHTKHCLKSANREYKGGSMLDQTAMNVRRENITEEQMMHGINYDERYNYNGLSESEKDIYDNLNEKRVA
ncbi:MAG: hypothetical protein ACI9N9_000050 [Enterobacterales bacterium]|jgi:hypothetical protein